VLRLQRYCLITFTRNLLEFLKLIYYFGEIKNKLLAMEIKERTESFDSVTSTDSYSFDDDIFFGENGRDRSSSIAYMMETVKYMERKNRHVHKNSVY
jgi:hypothetical protein